MVFVASFWRNVMLATYFSLPRNVMLATYFSLPRNVMLATYFSLPRNVMLATYFSLPRNVMLATYFSLQWEAYAINIALDLISESRNNKFIIFSDSLSVLESLKNRKFNNPLIIKILCKLENLSNDNDIQICWVPSHTGISGNDQADKAARSTLNIINEKKFKLLYTDFKMKINKYILQQRQQCWNSNKHNKKLATVVKDDLKAPFLIATTPRCREGCYSFPWIAPLYPWSVPYNAEC